MSYPNVFPDFADYMHPKVKPVKIDVSKPKNHPADFKKANERTGY